MKMGLKEPTSMEECVYFTNRFVGDDGFIKAWVYRQDCPSCGKSKMGKPVDPKTGKVKSRASEYMCSECLHKVPKQEYEDTLTIEIIYTCPKCKHEGEEELPFKRKKVQMFDEEQQKKVAVEAIVFECGKCKQKLYITKKMK